MGPRLTNEAIAAARLAAHDFERPRELRPSPTRSRTCWSRAACTRRTRATSACSSPACGRRGSWPTRLAAAYNPQLGSWWHGAGGRPGRAGDARLLPRPDRPGAVRLRDVHDGRLGGEPDGRAGGPGIGVPTASAGRSGRPAARPHASDQAHDSFVKIAARSAWATARSSASGATLASGWTWTPCASGSRGTARRGTIPSWWSRPWAPPPRERWTRSARSRTCAGPKGCGCTPTPRGARSGSCPKAARHAGRRRPRRLRHLGRAQDASGPDGRGHVLRAHQPIRRGRVLRAHRVRARHGAGHRRRVPADAAVVAPVHRARGVPDPGGAGPRGRVGAGGGPGGRGGGAARIAAGGGLDDRERHAAAARVLHASRPRRGRRLARSCARWWTRAASGSPRCASRTDDAGCARASRMQTSARRTWTSWWGAVGRALP